MATFLGYQNDFCKENVSCSESVCPCLVPTKSKKSQHNKNILYLSNKYYDSVISNVTVLVTMCNIEIDRHDRYK